MDTSTVHMHETLTRALSHYLSRPLCMFLSVAGDALQLGPVNTARQSRDPPVYDSRTFRDTFVSQYGKIVVLKG